ncbi:peptidylprolyl isomerase [Asticcacaulis sp. EMRT-3]|uniref:peptidylprolyl isomerase n=1 Tax=Asticcacaulis sp. EMRT-3 TaxID=3040349 RepID=UPI0024AFFB67|nr:peptidylprolyl isomerase [Asticcacaulis sp. EMRT-3]MDI7775318.1 peptidylprolyl isomerase [Asticcacaulis sp. EMRT-3]
MNRRFWALAGLVLLLAACSKPASKAPPPPAPPPKRLAIGLDVPPDRVRVEIDTSDGPIVLELDGKDAPITTANFLHYVDRHKLDGGSFYRAVSAGQAGFIQFNSGDRTFPPIPHEPTSQTHLSHTDGTVSTARYAVGTASNEFTICVGDMTYLDAGGNATPDHQGYAAFGHVVSGMAVVKQILHAPRSKAKPAPGDWPDEILARPVTILSAHRLS